MKNRLLTILGNGAQVSQREKKVKHCHTLRELVKTANTASDVLQEVIDHSVSMEGEGGEPAPSPIHQLNLTKLEIATTSLKQALIILIPQTKNFQLLKYICSCAKSINTKFLIYRFTQIISKM